MNKLFIIALWALTLSACTTFDPYTGEEKTSKTAIGASIGAGVAAVIAYIDNKDADHTTRRQRILKAAAGGALVGAGIGYYMDSQEAKLRKQLRGSGVSVVREGNNINLVMPSNITYATNSADINSNFYQVLNSVAVVLAEFDKTIVVVAGHTDSTGSERYNQDLSQQRAASVSSYLNSQGVIAERLDSVGFGEKVPVASNKSNSGRELNRRVEITLLPITA